MSPKTDWIRSQLRPDEDASEATSRLNTPTEIDNPIPQGKVPTAVDVDKLWDIVPPLEVFKTLNTLLWDRIVRAIALNNKALVSKYVGALVAGGCLTSATATKIGVALSGEMLDPNWKPRIITTPAKLAGFDAVMVHEVQLALENNETSIT
ncbi:hypothetical protein [Chamaesiphon sp. OTE_8_metabat_110]|uniref:hypothetical protein n=1 Tax=Chamaesiphon sp. OTE_8_metabat_110 TaxID=2964696 RepID=UPI00286C1770|nr:hypothetical protein [Chamaesiphon sp. OTE_8_metabat_110]